MSTKATLTFRQERPIVVQREVELPAFSSGYGLSIETEDRDGHPYVRGGSTVILSDQSRLKVTFSGWREYADFTGEDFTSLDMLVSYGADGPYEGEFASGEHARASFEEVLVVLERLVAKVREDLARIPAGE